ncbi:hypothetical protein E2C01_017521 [Portunus trituberculatus]|uniref:Uncharacterized protein n=1 Tax=Portunus trituberculatus TaxID=210409 RepID=A0A5B7DTP3_PORTR|nr:hypothetical protein [Portunus trituberculatus]
MRSVKVVLPESMCAEMPMFLILSSGRGPAVVQYHAAGRAHCTQEIKERIIRSHTTLKGDLHAGLTLRRLQEARDKRVMLLVSPRAARQTMLWLRHTYALSLDLEGVSQRSSPLID